MTSIFIVIFTKCLSGNCLRNRVVSYAQLKERQIETKNNNVKTSFSPQSQFGLIEFANVTNQLEISK